MLKKNKIETVLQCLQCHEPLHVKVVAQNVFLAGKDRRQHRQELFCPLCQKVTNLISHFRKQTNDQKK